METSGSQGFASRLRLFLAGFLMGAADIVPGVSGGTMAFILGIYGELVEAIRSCTAPKAIRLIVTLRWREAFRTLPWAFLLSLGLGIVSAIVALSSPLKWMLENRLPWILAFFFGLVAASIICVFRRVGSWKASRFVALLAGGAAGWIVVGLSQVQSPPDALWYLALCGAIAISAMILPGISGSFILLLMGRYDYVLNAVHQLRRGSEIPQQLAVLGVFALGVVIGIAVFIRLLAWLLRRYHDVTIALLIGFMMGSLRKVWPWKIADRIENANLMPSAGRDFWIALALALAGFLLVLAIEFVARRRESSAGGKKSGAEKPPKEKKPKQK